MKKLYILLLAFIVVLVSATENKFKEAQLSYPRVRTAYKEKGEYIKALCKEKGLNLEKIEIYFRAFKHEQELEVWARSSKEQKFVLLKTYSICASSGLPGPKLKKGDRQTPEGFYYIDRFNPASSFYLSLGINFPNVCDKAKCSSDPGGDIFIHGNCVTIGCIPLTDEYIKEVYLLAVEARDNGQSQIPVHIFPYKLGKCTNPPTEGGNKEFWANLKEGYDLFEKTHIPPTYEMKSDGTYKFITSK